MLRVILIINFNQFKNYIKIFIEDTYISKDSENQFSENFDNNIIVEFKNDKAVDNLCKPSKTSSLSSSSL